MNLRVLAAASDAGSSANEDACGTAGRFAWIVDGASGVSARTLQEGASDAAWLAVAIGDVLHERAARPDVTLDALLLELQGVLRRRFADALSIVPELDSDGPSACLGLLEFQPGLDGDILVRGAVIGDVCAFVPAPGGFERWTDERLKPFEAETLDVLGRSERPPEGIAEAVIEQIRRNRAFLNQEGGYFAVHPRLPWADRMLRFQAAIPVGAPVVLATDGFLRLCDLFGFMSEADLAAAAAAGGTARLLAALRDLERSDPEGKLHLRVKTHDDATVLAVAADDS